MYVAGREATLSRPVGKMQSEDVVTETPVSCPCSICGGPGWRAQERFWHEDGHWIVELESPRLDLRPLRNIRSPTSMVKADGGGTSSFSAPPHRAAG